jgi:subtilisin family serine protease
MRIASRGRRRIAAAAAVVVFGLTALPALAQGGRAPRLVSPKLSATLARVLDAGGADDLWRAVVANGVPGTVYYLAKLTGPIDDAALGQLEHAGAHVRARFDSIRWVALSSPLGAVANVAALDTVKHLTLDDVVHVAATSVQEAPAVAGFEDQAMRGTHDIGADDLWAKGITGGSVTIGVADSGVDGTHPDVGPKVTAFADCSAVAPNLVGELTAGLIDGLPTLPDGLGLCAPLPLGYDDNGHGTHVSGIAAGSGASNAELPGVAPAAKLEVAKVCNAGGVCLNSAVMAGIQHLAVGGAQVINMSLGGDRSYLAGVGSAGQVTTIDNPETELVDALADQYNIVFSISAGNSGPGLQSVGSPAVAGQAMAVAASITDWDLDHPTDETLHGVYGPIRPEATTAGAHGLAQFSSKGPSGEGFVKPDVAAPGSYIVSAEALTGGEVKAADLVTGHNWSSDPLHAVLSGTSMAAPSNAGAAALVIDGYHKATGADPAYYVVKAALANTAHSGAFEGPVTGLLSSIRTTRLGEDPHEAFPLRDEAWVGVTGEGAGRIDVRDAYLASTAGVVAYTPGYRNDGTLTTKALQPSWSVGVLAPGESAQQAFLVRGGPLLPNNKHVSWSFEPDPAIEGIGSIPASWVTLPGATQAQPNAEQQALMRVQVPNGTAPGLYAGTILGTAQLGWVTEHLRIPVQLFVTMAPNSEIDAPIFASGPTDYTAVGAESPVAGIATDWAMFPVRLGADTTSVTLTVDDPAGLAHMDLFAFDDRGEEIDSSVSPVLEQAVPNDLLLAPTGPDAPNEVVLLDGNDFTDLTLPTTIWVVVSDTVPGNAPGFETFHLAVATETGPATTSTTEQGGGGIGLPPLPVAAGTDAPSAPAAELDGVPAAAPGRPGGDGNEPLAVLALLLDAAVLLALTRRVRSRDIQQVS